MSLLDKIFGSKAPRDMKVLTPFVHKVHEATAEISNLTNDELRAKTQEFKNRIKEGIGEEEERISSLKQRLEEEYEMPVDEKESLYEEIDELENK